ncbi:M10 family metallopeptidase C-terminal domain-containing protein [Yersinia alsatica]|uniref:M10 family metallopeptidase C-terminal domain-containing protein n=1 Tax=Yersinia alsatica TaxID=2890317 RepID=UPI0011A0234E|nr:M10 family metallopeptidase C-terminal domain-containing protein [Yersinia alsatica]
MTKERNNHDIKSETIEKITTSYTYKNVNNKKGKTILYYSFDQEYSLWKADKEYQQGASTFFFTKKQRRQTKHSMRCVSDVANIRFKEATDDKTTNLLFSNFEDDNISISGYAYYPNKNKFSPIWINYATDNSEKAIKYNGKTIIHEIGHALGLQHTHDHGHTQQTSIMSYLSEKKSGADYGRYYASSLQMLDIAALQQIYGANMKTRTCNTTYGFNTTLKRATFRAKEASDILIFCIWDAGGIDTLDFSGYGQNQNINLNEGSFSDVGGLTGNISIALGVCIENAIGGSGDDKIWGNSANNTLIGGGGADQLWGDGGNNTFGYRRISDSLVTAADTIHDFISSKDKIDLSHILSDGLGIKLVDQFSNGKQTEIIQSYDDIDDITYLIIEFNNETYGHEDMLIQLTGRHQLSLNNFIVSQPLVA